MNKKLLYIIPAIALTFSCQKEIQIGSDIDESKYDNVTEIIGSVNDQKTGLTDNVIEIRKETYQTSVQYRLSKAPNKGVNVKLSYDASYADVFNSIHGTNFELYPESKVSISDEGHILVAPDEKRSYSLDLTIEPDSSLEEGKTYLLPIKSETATDGIKNSESASHCVYMVRNYFHQSDCNKGDDAVKTFLYYGANPLNLQEFVLEDGKLFFDVITIFAANINYSLDKGNVYININDNLKHIFENNDTYLQPLRKRGVKILLGLLGNHDQSGLAQLSDMGCREFASQITAFVNKYNLDGVNFDDEYSNSPDLSNPLFAPHSRQQAARLCFECKLRMPDKIISVYDWGSMYGVDSVDGIPASMWLDSVVGDYGAIPDPIGGLTRKNCSGASTELVLWRNKGSEAKARQVRNNGYGYYMFFDLYKGSSSNFQEQVRNLQEVCRGLYDRELLTPKVFYREQEFTPVSYPDPAW